MLLEGKGGAKDETKGVDFLKRACNGSVGAACADLGLMTETGKGAPKNVIPAKQIYSRGSFRNNADACVNGDAWSSAKAATPTTRSASSTRRASSSAIRLRAQR